MKNIELLWSAVCNNELVYVKKYYADGGEANIRYPAFMTNHSLIMGALRNGYVEMVRLLQDNGETIEPYEQDEYNAAIKPLLKKYYAPEIEKLKAPFHINLDIEGEKCTATSPEYPEFKAVCGATLDEAYFALCEYLKKENEKNG